MKPVAEPGRPLWLTRESECYLTESFKQVRDELGHLVCCQFSQRWKQNKHKNWLFCATRNFLEVQRSIYRQQHLLNIGEDFWERLASHLGRSLRIDQIIICLRSLGCDYPLGQRNWLRVSSGITAPLFPEHHGAQSCALLSNLYLILWLQIDYKITEAGCSL